MTGPVVCAPMYVELLAVRNARASAVHTGMGPVRSAHAAHRLRDASAVLVVGVAGGLGPHVRSGDVVVASEVRGPDGDAIPSPSAPLLAAELRRLGLTVHIGPIESQPKVVTGPAREKLAVGGALAVDTESYWLAPAGKPFAVVRSIVDMAQAPLLHPATLARGARALRALRVAVPAIDAWSNSLCPAEVAERDAVPGRRVDEIVTTVAGLGPLVVPEPSAPPENFHVTLTKEVS